MTAKTKLVEIFPRTLAAGGGPKEAAIEAGCTEKYAYVMGVQLGFIGKAHKGKLTLDQRVEISGLLAQGVRVCVLAKKFGITPPAVLKYRR